MGYIGGKFLAAAFGKHLFRHVKGQQYHTDHSPIRFDAADVNVYLPAIFFHPDFSVPILQSGQDGLAHFMVPVQCQKILSDAGVIRAEKPPCGRVDAQNCPLLIQHHQPFVHAPRDLLKFIGFGPQLTNLGADLTALLPDAPQQRS